MIQEHVNNLKKLGLSTYEATAYITLTSLISATAVKISEESTIPRTKIYDVLKSLAKKEYIEIENGRPLIYHVKSPLITLEKEKEKFTESLDKTIVTLNSIYEHEISQVQAPIWRISGIQNIIQKEIEIIQRSKETLSLRIGFLFKDEYDAIINALVDKNNEIDINILASPYTYIENKKIDVIDLFKKEGLAIYKANIPFVKMITSDSKELLHIYAKFSEDKKSVIPYSAIGIWNQYEDIAKNYEDRFKKQLEKIKKQ